MTGGSERYGGERDRCRAPGEIAEVLKRAIERLGRSAAIRAIASEYTLTTKEVEKIKAKFDGEGKC